MKQRNRVVFHFEIQPPKPSWPDQVRPSTTSAGSGMQQEDVDARLAPGMKGSSWISNRNTTRNRMLSRLSTIACISLLMYGLSLPPTAIAAGFSNWQYEYGVGSRGTPICSILSAVRNANIGENIVIKGLKGEENLHIDLYKDTWNIPQGTDVNVTFDFGDNEPLTLPAYGDGHILDVELPTQHTAIFLSLVVERPFIQVIFPGGNEGTWVVAAGGARPATMKLIECLRRLGPSKGQGTSSRAPTQPFGAPTPTQPFGSGTNR